MQSQCYFLKKIKETDSVLILGGGTGELLESLPQCKSVSFLDLSEKMIAIAKTRVSKNSIDFIHSDLLTHDFQSKYDVIICPFFLDCFNAVNLSLVLKKIKRVVNSEGSLIVTDFQRLNNNSFLLGTMHLFFQTFSSLESSQLKNIHKEVQLEGFNIKEEKIFHRNMIFSRLYGNL